MILFYKDLIDFTVAGHRFGISGERIVINIVAASMA